jgi:uncharacterized DUF497 family protein
MEFEYDEGKSQKNKAKHGIDFEEAKAIWKDNNRIEAEGREVKEVRTITIGKIDDRLWAAVTTRRGNALRIISVRPIRRKEKEAYEGDKENIG